jgi:hypothetical protein
LAHCPCENTRPVRFFVIKGISLAYTDIVPSFELSSDHTPIITTISSSVIIRHNALRLHIIKLTGKKYREEIANNIILKIMLKNPEDLDSAIETLTKVMQPTALQSTPPLAPHKCMNNIPLEIKELLKEKRKVRALWQRTNFPSDKTRYNQLTDKLKTKLKKR